MSVQDILDYGIATAEKVVVHLLRKYECQSTVENSFERETWSRQEGRTLLLSNAPFGSIFPLNLQYMVYMYGWLEQCWLCSAEGWKA